MQLPIFKLTTVVKSGLAGPFVVSFAVELAVFKLAFIKVSVLHLQSPSPVKHVCQKLSFVDYFFTSSRKHGHFALALHLRINKVPYVMPAIWPLEFSIALDLAILKVSTVDEGLLSLELLVWVETLGLNLDLLPFFITLAVYKVVPVENSRNLNGSSLRLFNSLPLHLILPPRPHIL